MNTIKQIYKRHFHMNDISQEISYDVVREQCTEVQTETPYHKNKIKIKKIIKIKRL